MTRTPLSLLALVVALAVPAGVAVVPDPVRTEKAFRGRAHQVPLTDSAGSVDQEGPRKGPGLQHASNQADGPLLKREIIERHGATVAARSGGRKSAGT